MESTTHRVHPDEAGRRLDRFLRKALPKATLGAIFKLLRTGRIRVNSKKAKPEARLAEGDEVQLRLYSDELQQLGWSRAGAPPAPRKAAGPTPRRPGGGRWEPPQVIHRDDDILVLSKPPGLAAQGGTDQGDAHVAALLPDWLRAWQVQAGARTFRPAPAHRLDKGTSGCLAVGLSVAGLRGLVEAFREHRARKTYLALVEEHGPPLPERGSCDLPLLTRSKPGARRPRTVADPQGKPALTEWQVLGRGPLSSTGKAHRERQVALLALWPLTGRNHQIRAHCAALQVPLIGDPRYGGTIDPQARPPQPGQLAMPGHPYLHAVALEMPHPTRDGVLQAIAPLPSRWHNLVPWLPDDLEDRLPTPPSWTPS